MARLYWSLSVALLFWQAPAQTVAPKPPVSATIRIESVVKLLDGNTLSSSTTGRFYRDIQQRTRTEIGNRVMIFDPLAKKAITLDKKTRTARVVDLENRPD